MPSGSSFLRRSRRPFRDPRACCTPGHANLPQTLSLAPAGCRRLRSGGKGSTHWAVGPGARAPYKCVRRRRIVSGARRATRLCASGVRCSPVESDCIIINQCSPITALRPSWPTMSKRYVSAAGRGMLSKATRGGPDPTEMAK